MTEARESDADVRRVPSGWRPVVVFVVLAYGLGWMWWIPLALGGETVTHGATPTQLPGLMAPALAALLVTAFTTGRIGLVELVHRMLRWRIGLVWWGVAVSPVLVAVVVLVAKGAATGRWPTAVDLGGVNGFPDVGGFWGLAVLVVLLVVVNGLGEETGWRGFLQLRLRTRMGFVPAVAVVTLVWAGWHLPLFWVLESFEGFGPGTLTGFLVGMFAGAVVLGWIVERTGSVLAVACWHASYNLGSATVAARGSVAAAVTTVVMVQAAIVLGWRLWHRPDRERGVA
ncbi:CPBP family intramembrane glutamic endopeptidase [Actinomadura gamaensis]|uniref:CPBP family intramembrane glutamic endopeptidase n=1 Tax=Actinomadura gamaensis TaxID=1763541 RepID=A0ABV9U0F6_9ACTN